MRVCRYCLREKHVSAFDKTPAGNLRWKCRTCSELTREQNRIKNPEAFRLAKRYVVLKNKYGISREEYEAHNAEQQNLCAICNKPETSMWRGELRWLSVDHDHETGKVRGLLCHACNVGIGLLREDTQILKNAIAYLERSRND